MINLLAVIVILIAVIIILIYWIKNLYSDIKAEKMISNSYKEIVEKYQENEKQKKKLHTGNNSVDVANSVELLQKYTGGKS